MGHQPEERALCFSPDFLDDWSSGSENKHLGGERGGVAESKRVSECSKEEEMERRWVGSREGGTQSGEMRQCDKGRKVSGRRKEWM